MKRVTCKGGELLLDLGRPNPKQAAFFASRCRYTAYGGARGGGKSWAVRVKAIAGALRYAGIRILILRRTYPELENTMIEPLLKTVRSATRDGKTADGELAVYTATTRTVRFLNGSTIRFGHLNGERTIGEYQGQEYDWIFLDEATQFSEWEFRVLAATLRGIRAIPKRMYLTCNPGGIGHQWVKRLFIDRVFYAGEDPEDYLFIPATVEDNRALLDASPDYIKMLDLLPEDIRAAHRYGDWSVMAGQFFPEFRRETHVVKPFPIPEGWERYRAIDYGLDMFACLWIAVDTGGRAWVYREVQQPGLIVSDAAELMKRLTPAGERILCTIAPPDLWSTQKDTGRTMAGIFGACGVGLVKAKSRRVQGWMALKEFLKAGEDGRPGLLVFHGCEGLIHCLPALLHDPKNPNDCATEPHDITHICDALRYFAQFRTREAGEEKERLATEGLTGGCVDGSYLFYGG